MVKLKSEDRPINVKIDRENCIGLCEIALRIGIKKRIGIKGRLLERRSGSRRSLIYVELRRSIIIENLKVH